MSVSALSLGSAPAQPRTGSDNEVTMFANERNVVNGQRAVIVPTTLQITCITKSSQYTRIEAVGGPGFRYTLDQAIAFTQNETYHFYTVAANGTSVWVEVDHRNGVPYLKTMPDGTPLDNLLHLQNPCPI